MEQENSVRSQDKKYYSEQIVSEECYRKVCLQDILQKLSCKYEELAAKNYSVLNTTKLLMREALDLLCFFNAQSEVTYCFLDEGHKEAIVNCGTSEYLKEWLKHDKTTYCNMREFCRYWFSEKNGKENVIFDDDIYRKFWRSVQLVLARRKAVAEQSKTAGRPYSREFHKKTLDTSKLDLLLLWESEKRVFGSGDKDYPDLKILDYLVEKKTPCKNDALIEAYQTYYRLFEALVPENAKGLSDREYVVSSMQLHEIEYLNRIHLSAVLAKHMMERGGYPPRSEACSMLWSPFLEDPVTPVAPPTGRGLLEFYSYSVNDYKDQIRYVYEPNNQRNVKYMLLYNLQERLTRHMIKLVETVKPVSGDLPGWTAEDYREAREFYENDMMLYRIYTQNPFGDGAQEDCEPRHKEELAKYIKRVRALLETMHDPRDQKLRFYLEERRTQMQPLWATIKNENARLRYQKDQRQN